MTRLRQILDMNAYQPDGGHVEGALGRRLDNLGAASVLFYRDPIEMVAARGATMIARDGTEYLDFYNNVPSVGHTHPKVVAAVQAQIAALNIHTRYIVDVVDRYAEALKSHLPETLSNVVLTCSGSEANDLAIRVARAASGGTGVIVTETAYHGNTYLTTDVSPSALKQRRPPDWVAIAPPPDPKIFSGGVAEGFAGAVREAISELQSMGHKPAALLVDSIFSSDGIYADPPGMLAAAVAAIRAEGGLFIADEVQPGFGRTGTGFWGFERHGLIPDMVTMGKPMGNGFPMAGVAARPDHLSAFCQDVGYFNTFGGNPVAAAAGLAVLEVIAEEGLQANANQRGTQLLQGLKDIAARSASVAEVRGAGLFLGIDIVAAETGSPDPDVTVSLIEALRREGVLIGAAGKFGATLKIRPPLCLTEQEAERFLAAFARAVALVQNA